MQKLVAALPRGMQSGVHACGFPPSLSLHLSNVLVHVHSLTGPFHQHTGLPAPSSPPGCSCLLPSLTQGGYKLYTHSHTLYFLMCTVPSSPLAAHKSYRFLSHTAHHSIGSYWTVVSLMLSPPFSVTLTLNPSIDVILSRLSLIFFCSSPPLENSTNITVELWMSSGCSVQA